MNIIIDSGSTKASWCIAHENQPLRMVDIAGFNPSIHDDMSQETKNEIINIIDGGIVQNIFFYGAGVTENSKQKVKDTFSFLNPVGKFEVESDMLCAARSVCGDESGVVGILGTGSNSCYFDGKTCHILVPSLGYILSDEGGGVHLGKELLKSYFYNKMPMEERNYFEENYSINKNELIKYLYEMHAGSGFIAKFARFLGDVKTDWTNSLIERVFNEYIETRILVYKEHLSKPIHFIGSIASEHQIILQKCLESKGLNMGRIEKRPILRCAEYHIRNIKKQ